MLIVDLLLAIVLLGLTGYHIYSSYTLYKTSTDEGVKKALKQSFMIQGLQMLLTFGILYTAVKTTAAPSYSAPAY
jgi:hypothetical protein